MRQSDKNPAGDGGVFSCPRNGNSRLLRKIAIHHKYITIIASIASGTNPLSRLPRFVQALLCVIGGLIAAGVLHSLVVLGFFACCVLPLFPPVSRCEVARTASPLPGLDAVLFETNGGATTSFGYDVYVVTAGHLVQRSDRPVASVYGAHPSRFAPGVNLRWHDADLLIAEYLHAYSVEQPKPTVRIGNRTVRIELRDGIDVTSTPTGSMERNLRLQSSEVSCSIK